MINESNEIMKDWLCTKLQQHHTQFNLQYQSIVMVNYVFIIEDTECV